MQEVIDLLTEDPERTTALASAATTATGAAYVGYKNDFGATLMTTNELETYMEENSGITLNPGKIYRKHVYSNELDRREEQNQV